MSLRSRLGRLECLTPAHVTESELVPVTPAERVQIMRSVLLRLGMADPFPTLMDDAWWTAYQGAGGLQGLWETQP